MKLTDPSRMTAIFLATCWLALGAEGCGNSSDALSAAGASPPIAAGATAGGAGGAGGSTGDPFAGSGASAAGTASSGGNSAGASGGALGSAGGGAGTGGTGNPAGASGNGAAGSTPGNGGSSAGAAGNSGPPSTAGTGGGGSNSKATIVVRGAGTATAGDQVMMGRIMARGFQTITVVSDAAVTAQSVVGSALVVISSSAESGPLKAKLKDVAIPVLVIEDAEFSLMGMAGTGDHDAGVSMVNISAASPLVGSLTGMVTISSKAGELGWGTVAPSAMIGATMPGNAAHATIFGYEKGAQMSGMVAPARRAGFAIRETLAANLNADGLKLFDSILTWVVQ